MSSAGPTDDEELDQLKATLSQLSSQLDANPTCTDYEELSQLREELVELIQLKEDQLLRLKKESLATLVQGLLESSNELALQSSTDDCQDSRPQFDVGQHCSIPGWTSNGKFIQHNVVVAELVKEDESDEHQSPTYARVFFAHPTRLNEVPCQQFVEHGSCHRGVRCHASHGKLVPIEDLAPLREPDLTKFSREGQACLVKDKRSSGLWRHARLLHADLASHSCVIEWGHAFARDGSTKRKSYSDLEQSVANVSVDMVHLLSEDEQDSEGDDLNGIAGDDSSCSSSDSDDVEDTGYRDDTLPVATSSDSMPISSGRRTKVKFVLGGLLNPEDILKAMPCNDPVPATALPENQCTIGEWEAHTRGIGSRLLSKLGYDGTSGLGSYGQGRKLPVALLLEKFQIRPRKWNKRPSLDLVVDSQSKPRPRRRPKSDASLDSAVKQDNVPAQPGVFNLLNTALNRCESAPASQTNPNIPKTKLSPSDFRVQSFKIHEEIERTLRKIQDVRKSVERNQNKDRVMAKQAEQRLSGLQAQLAQLRQSERFLQTSQQKQTKEKKLRIF